MPDVFFGFIVKIQLMHFICLFLSLNSSFLVYTILKLTGLQSNLLDIFIHPFNSPPIPILITHLNFHTVAYQAHSLALFDQKKKVQHKITSCFSLGYRYMYNRYSFLTLFLHILMVIYAFDLSFSLIFIHWYMSSPIRKNVNSQIQIKE
jgi:hypothetical protein